MRIGDERTDAAVLLVASSTALAAGRWAFSHPRNGRCVLERREYPTGGIEKAFRWVCVECERPDAEVGQS